MDPILTIGFGQLMLSILSFVKHRQVRNTDRKFERKAWRVLTIFCFTAFWSDIRNKIVSAITKNYRYVVFQDESIHAWHAGNHGKKVQHSGIGAILRDLKNKSITPIMVDKFFPSTQLCPCCGIKNKMTVDKRVYECECGFKEDRDIKSACCILEEGLKTIPMDRRDFKARENVSSTQFDFISGIKVSKMCSEN